MYELLKDIVIELEVSLVLQDNSRLKFRRFGRSAHIPGVPVLEYSNSQFTIVSSHEVEDLLRITG